MNTIRIYNSILTEKVETSVEYQLMNLKVMMDLENHHLNVNHHNND